MLRKEVVGRGQGAVQGPTVPSASSTPKPSATYLDTINARLNSQGVKIADPNKISVSDAWINNAIADGHSQELALVFKKLGKSVKSTKELKTLLADYPEVTSAKDFVTGYQTLASMIIPGMGANNGPSTTQTITQYDDKYLQSVGNSIAQDFLGRNLNTEELNKIMPKLQEIVNKGTTTTSKVVGGKNVVTTTPGFSQAKAEGVVQQELRLGASQDLQTKQYVDFADFLSKNMAGM
jgi:hypothetical protein